jgi:hypothetical protein
MFGSGKRVALPQPARTAFPFCTFLAGIIAVTGTGLAVWQTIREISVFAPGTSVRFVLGGAVVAAMTFVFTCAWAVGGMLVDRRFLPNLLFICIAFAATPLSTYTLKHVTAQKGVILKP